MPQMVNNFKMLATTKTILIISLKYFITFILFSSKILSVLSEFFKSCLALKFLQFFKPALDLSHLHGMAAAHPQGEEVAYREGEQRERHR